MLPCGFRQASCPIQLRRCLFQHRKPLHRLWRNYPIYIEPRRQWTVPVFYHPTAGIPTLPARADWRPVPFRSSRPYCKYRRRKQLHFHIWKSIQADSFLFLHYASYLAEISTGYCGYLLSSPLTGRSELYCLFPDKQLWCRLLWYLTECPL